MTCPFTFHVLPENTEATLEPVWQLVYDEYIHEGYCDHIPSGLLRHYRHLDMIPQTQVIVGLLGGEVVGTNSLTADGPAKLHTDIAFPQETESVREECKASGLRLGASWRIVTNRLHKVRSLLLGIIDLSVSEGQKIADVVLYTFNPRHENCYRRMLGLETIARRDNDPSVNGAAAVLMRGDMDVMLRTWNRFYKRNGER